MIGAHRAQHAERLASYERAAEDLREAPTADASVDSSRLATLEFGLRYERAVLDWFEWLPAALPDLTDSASA